MLGTYSFVFNKCVKCVNKQYCAVLWKAPECFISCGFVCSTNFDYVVLFHNQTDRHTAYRAHRDGCVRVRSTTTLTQLLTDRMGGKTLWGTGCDTEMSPD